MALRYIDSFDHYENADITSKGWDLSHPATGGNQINIIPGRFGNSLNINTAIRTAQRTFDAQQTWTVGGACMFDNPGTGIPGVNVLFAFLDTPSYPVSTTTQCELRFAADRKLYVTRNGTQIAAGTTVLRLDFWYYVEFKVTIHGSAGVAEVHLDGATEIAQSGLNTQTTAHAYADVFSFGGGIGGGGGVWLDDFYICDATGSAPTNTFLGDVRVEALFPSGNGNSSQWVGQDSNSVDNYLNVDETTPPDSDTTYNQSPTVGNEDTYAYTNLTPATGTVFGVQPCMYARKTDAGIRSVSSVARAGASEIDSTAQALSTSYRYLTDIRETKPGGGAWTIADVNAAEFGIKVTA